MNNLNLPNVDIYTDGSCDTQLRVGAWVAIILYDKTKQVISGIETDTTHNRMELMAVIEAIKFVNSEFKVQTAMMIFSDSQYVTGLPNRKKSMESTGFLTRKGTPVQNELLVKILFNILSDVHVNFEKVIAHQKKTTIINYNIEADLFARKLVREKVKEITAIQ
ncbi:MAG: RNase H family protein [Bacteroidota bacterium]